MRIIPERLRPRPTPAWSQMILPGGMALHDLLAELGVRETIANFEMLSSPRATLSYDFPAWLADGVACDPNDYRLPGPTEFIFELTEEGRRELERSLRRCVPAVAGAGFRPTPG